MTTTNDAFEEQTGIILGTVKHNVLYYDNLKTFKRLQLDILSLFSDHNRDA